MNNRDRRIIVTLVSTLLATIVITSYALLVGNPMNLRSFGIIWGGLSFLSLALVVSYQFALELFSDFMIANARGKLILVIIILGFILKAFSHFMLSR